MPRTLLTNVEFALLPDAPGKQELLEGEVILLPPAKLPHASLMEVIFLLLKPAFGRRAHSEFGYQLGHDSWLQPDVSVTWPGQAIQNGYLQGSPMIAVEVVSPGNTTEEILRKTAVYLAHSAEEVWIVYPQTRTMFVHTSTGSQAVTGIYRTKDVTVDLPALLDEAASYENQSSENQSSENQN